MASDPTRIAVSVQRENLTREMIEKTGLFNVSVLTEDVPMEIIQRFGFQSGRDVDKFADFPAVKRCANGLCYLTEHTNAMFSCRVTETMDLGSHVLFIGQVEQSQVLGKAPSCTYAHYHKVIKSEFSRRIAMKYVCPCGYEYDPAIGDPENGIAPGTAWEDVPADWVCPVCGLDKDAFEEQ